MAGGVAEVVGHLPSQPKVPSEKNVLEALKCSSAENT
jgi:hypothetical protein